MVRQSAEALSDFHKLVAADRPSLCVGEPLMIPSFEGLFVSSKNHLFNAFTCWITRVTSGVRPIREPPWNCCWGQAAP